MNGRDFLAVAQTLTRGRAEAEWRSAVSRAYYAAFRATRDFLGGLRFVTPRADRAHEYLYRRLNNCGNVAVINPTTLLHDLRKRRNMGDYDMGVAYSAGVAAACVADAEAVMKVLDGLTLAERTQIADAMKLYEQGIGDLTWRP